MFNLYLYRNKPFVTFLVLLSVSTSLMFFNIKLTIDLQSILFFITYPVEYSVQAIGKFVSDSFTSISKIQELEEELRITQESLERYKRSQLSFSQLQKENEKLKEKLSIKAKINYNTKYARIVFRDPNLTGDYLIIDKGAVDGINVNMPVISYDSSGNIFLIGKIEQVNISASKVRLITAIDSYVGVTLKSSGYVGVLKGSGSWNQNCSVEYIPVEADAFEGEIVVTSGESDIYPPGLFVGRIVGIGKSSVDDFFKKIYVRPEFKYSKTRDVFVVDWKPNVQIDNLIEKTGE